MSENEGATIGNLIYNYSMLCLLIIINPILVKIKSLFTVQITFWLIP